MDNSPTTLSTADGTSLQKATSATTNRPPLLTIPTEPAGRAGRRSLSSRSLRSLRSLSWRSTKTAEVAENIDDYVNPLYSTPRWVVAAQAGTIRTTSQLAAAVMGYIYPASRTILLDSTVSITRRGPQVIPVDVWEPQTLGRTRVSARPAVINFHGGGFMLGLGTDDAVWLTRARDELGAVVFSVNYRLAPTYPFPVGLEDCVDAIVQIASRADEFRIDPDKIILSGFSAGGNLLLAAWTLMQTPERWGYQLPVKAPRIAGLVQYYPLLDYTITRARKRSGSVRPDLVLPKGLTDLFDACYLWPPKLQVEREDPRLSPALMDEELLDVLPPLHLCLCEYDMLLAEGLTWADRVRGAGGDVTARIVSGEKHSWDKPPPVSPKANAVEEYKAALESVKRWLSGGTNGGSGD